MDKVFTSPTKAQRCAIDLAIPQNHQLNQWLNRTTQRYRWNGKIMTLDVRSMSRHRLATIGETETKTQMRQKQVTVEM
jgi:hypothetical protein